MCDSDSIDDILEFQRRAELSRRRFGAMAVGTGVTFAAETRQCRRSERVGGRDQDARWAAMRISSTLQRRACRRADLAGYFRVAPGVPENG